MAVKVEAESTLTDRYQTTVPESVRRAMGLEKRDKIHYELLDDGSVRLTRASAEAEDDPALKPFLAFIENDLAAHPERVRAVDQRLADRIQALVGDVEVDLDAPLPPEDE